MCISQQSPDVPEIFEFSHVISRSSICDLNFVQLAFADKKAGCPLGKPIGGSSLEEVELRGGQEVSHLPAPCSGCPIPRVKPWNFFWRAGDLGRTPPHSHLTLKDNTQKVNLLLWTVSFPLGRSSHWERACSYENAARSNKEQALCEWDIMMNIFFW